MQSRISCFNTAVFRKNLTRFAPAWMIYLAGCLLVILNLVGGYKPQTAGEILGSSLSLMAFANSGYAPVCALLLFGDLFNARLCNALHAAPLRRETWFFTHLISALVFCLIPYGAVAVCTLPILSWNWGVAGLWLLGSVLQFIFFFALAVFCVFCTGSRFAAAVFYGLLSFLAMMAAWFVEVIYGPLLTGVTVSTEWAEPLTPLVYMMSNNDWMSWFDKISRAQNGIGVCWTYLLVLTAVSVVLYSVSLVLYQRRKLECAGDFVAVKAIGPVFLVVYTLSMGVVFHLFDAIFVGNDTVGAFFAVGLAIGWFTGQMLLKRTVRVFRGKTILGFVIMAAVLLVSILMTWADPFGITRWVPDAEDVKAVQLDGYGYYYSGGVMVEEETEIRDITDVHAQAIEENVTGEVYYGNTVALILRYQLANGTTAERTYYLNVDTELAQRLIPYFSDPEVILGYEDWDTFLDQLYQIRIDWNDELLFTGEDAASLAQAIKADCEEGHMVQHWEFHQIKDGYNDVAVNVDIVAGDRHFDFVVYEDCVHTVQWLRDRGIISE